MGVHTAVRLSDDYSSGSGSPYLENMSERTNTAYRWGWFALACVALVLWCLLNRYRVERCEDGACYIRDAWTGTVEFRLTPLIDPTGNSEPLPPVPSTDTTMP